MSNVDTRTTPVISTPPSILFVDLDLAPGETKKCKSSTEIPCDRDCSRLIYRANSFVQTETSKRHSSIASRKSNSLQLLTRCWHAESSIKFILASNRSRPHCASAIQSTKSRRRCVWNVVYKPENFMLNMISYRGWIKTDI